MTRGRPPGSARSLRAASVAIALAGCLEPPVPGSGPADASVGGSDGASIGVEVAIGDVLTYSFEDGQESPFVRDRSGAGRHGDSAGSQFEPDGQRGSARRFHGGMQSYVRTAADPDLHLGNLFTVETWVRRDGDGHQALYGDHDGDAALSFELAPGGGLRLVTSYEEASELREVVVEPDPGATVPPGVWTHVAVTWNAQEVRFFIDGEAIGSSRRSFLPPARSPPRPYRAGQRVDGTHALVGALDELKVSRYPKSAEQIRASMQFDATGPAARCGDGVIEEGEECEFGACCAVATCQFAAATPCGEGGECSQGRCEPFGSPQRVTDDTLEVLYRFDRTVPDEGGASWIPDDSGKTPPADLAAPDEVSATLGGGVLTIEQPTRLVARHTGRLAAACMASGELTIEVWARPASDSTSVPEARLVLYSINAGSRDFLLGQAGRTWASRIRTTGTDFAARPLLLAASGDAGAGALGHVVATYKEGVHRIYLDGRLRAVGQAPGDFTSWFEHVLAVGSDVNAALPWLGEIHLIAIYSRALDELEVARNYAASAAAE
jgi:hypothetical protein